VLAAIGAIPARLLLAAHDGGTNVPTLAIDILGYFVLINIALMLFNLVPIPPLDGSKVLFSFMSARQVMQYRPVLEQYGFILLIFVAFVPILPGQETIFNFIFEKIGLPVVNLLLGRAFFR
jgi:Zn-dependent protease